MAFIPPEFAGYAEKDPGFALAMTKHLYGDPSYPGANRPELWADGPKVQFVNRNLTFTDVPATPGANTSEQVHDLGGGRNYILFGRSVTVLGSTARTAQLPNQDTDFINYQEEVLFGRAIVEEGPLSIVFGSTPAFPYALFRPELGFGGMLRRYTLENNTGTVVSSVILGFQLALLDTGR